MSGSTESPFPRSNLSLRTRAGLLVGGTMLLLLLTLMLTSSLVIGHFFVGLQDSLSGERIRRVSQVLGQLGAAKERLVRDNAQWDEAYEFLAGRNGDFLQRNYAPGVASADQDLVLAFNAQRQLVGVVQSRDDSADPYTAPAGLNLAEFAGPRLLADAAVSGLMVGDGRVLAVAACPVLPSNLSGPSNGWLVFGTWFGPGRMKEISVTAAAPIAVHPAGQRPSSEGGIVVEVDVPHLGDGRAAFPSVSQWGRDHDQFNATLVVKSVAGAGDAAVDVGIISLVYRRAIAARDWLVAISALCGILCVVAAVAAMEWAMIRPLIALDREMSAMSRAEAQVGRLKADRGDEIGRLAHSANLLLERVQAGRRDAQEQRELLSSVLDSTTEGVMAFRCVRDADGRIADLTIISANHSAEKMLRVTISDIVGCSVRETYPRLIRAGVYDRWVRVAETGEPAVFESFYEGHRIAGWFLYAIAPWGDGVVVTFRDISERKAREKELAESYAEMERFNAAMIGREERIIEMKREVNALRAQLDLPPVYQMEEGHDS